MASPQLSHKISSRTPCGPSLITSAGIPSRSMAAVCQLSLPESKVLMVGDSPYDVESAARAGAFDLPVILLTGDRAAATMVR